MADSLQRKVNKVWVMIERGSNNPVIQQLAVKFLSKELFGAPLAAWDVWKGIHEWAQRHIDFVPEHPGRDRFQEATETLRLGKGDCEDFTILLGSVARHLGLPLRLRVASPDRYRWLHIYPVGGYPSINPSQWISVDASAKTKPIGWENTTKYHFFRDYGLRERRSL